MCKDTEVLNDPLDDSLDLTNFSKRKPLQILIIGPPNSKKLQLAEAVSKKFELEHLNVENWINSILED